MNRIGLKHEVTLPLQMNIPQLSKDAHNESPHDIHASTTTKGNSTTVDEFKYGFPFHGLSSISYKWWGSKLNCGNSQQSQITDTKETRQLPKSSADAAANSSSVDVKMSEVKASLTDVDSQWTSSLTALRKRAVEDGRKSLKLGVYKGYGVKNLDRSQKMALVQIFRSPLPGGWENQL
ncbi:uncharacterized protein [Primulina huaijiensis]|uniref:uncharacterized protein n=1 Tax=Primulina huaijiensis TaxID=1492673 RepID=UPI003CC73ECB